MKKVYRREWKIKLKIIFVSCVSLRILLRHLTFHFSFSKRNGIIDQYCGIKYSTDTCNITNKFKWNKSDSKTPLDNSSYVNILHIKTIGLENRLLVARASSWGMLDSKGVWGYGVVVGRCRGGTSGTLLYLPR